MRLIEQYERSVEQGVIKRDQSQIQALIKLQQILEQLEAPGTVWQRIFKQKALVKGLYFYGTVGVGKTYLMDLFYDSVVTTFKLRMHFHSFMRDVDRQLRQLQGVREPLVCVAKNIAHRARLLCFDEFFVHDIADAMILGRLFTQLFAHGVTLVATSNIAPDGLYWNGLHRKRFLPTIELIKRHCDVYQFESKQDYRLRELLKVGVYFYPLNQYSENRLNDFFRLNSHGSSQECVNLWIENREVPTVKWTEKVVWFDFDELCNIPRSQLDYIDVAQRFDVVILNNVRQMSARENVLATNFIHLIDVLYDQGIHLIIAAEVPVENLYEEGDKQFEFQRTVSRLTEMQTKAYLEKMPHPMFQALTRDSVPED